MERKNKSVSLILVGLLTITLSSRQIHAAVGPHEIANVAHNIAALVSTTNIAQSSWYTPIVEFFCGTQPATLEPVDPFVGMGDVTKELFQYESAATVFEKTATQQAEMNLFKEQDSQACQLARKDNTETLQNVKPGDADINAVDVHGETTLMRAAKYGYSAIISALLNPESDVNATDKNGNTALMVAAWHGSRSAVNALLSANANINAVNNWGTTALMLAAWYGRGAVAHALIDAGADINARSNDDKTALDLATTDGHYYIAGMLKDAGAHE